MLGATEANLQLISLLLNLNFDTNYYRFVESTMMANDTQGIDAVHAIEVVEQLPIHFKFKKKERYFHYRASKSPELGLNFTYTPHSVEFILVFRPNCGHIGNTFPMLALDTIQRRRSEPDLELSIGYPRPRFGSVADFKMVLSFGLSLYLEIEREIERLAW